jgi:hypothetical protein
MKSEKTMIHTCEFCRKYYKRKNAAEWHELHCRENPKNKHKCFEFCKHLKKTDWIEPTEYGGDQKVGVEFTCGITGKQLHSYVAERRKLSLVDWTTRMPLECETFEAENWCSDF